MLKVPFSQSLIVCYYLSVYFLTAVCYNSNKGTPTLKKKKPRTAAIITHISDSMGCDSSNFNVSDLVTFYQSLDSSRKIILAKFVSWESSYW